MDKQAFPCCEEIYYDELKTGITYHEGLTKREYFAAMALQGYLASYDESHEPTTRSAAEHAVEYADALILALNKKSDRSE